MASNAAPRAHRPVVGGLSHVAAAGHYMAAQAAMQVLEAGGNAVDAGCAAGIATGVLEGVHVSVGGVAPIMIYLAQTRQVVTISGLGTWPKAASAAYFQQKHGGKIPTGIARTVIPAAPDAWITALERFGTMSFGAVAAAATRIAREGFPVYPYMHRFLTKNRSKIERYPTTTEIYYPGGKVPAVGQVFVQRDLAATLQYMADEERAAAAKGERAAGLAAARHAFYQGDVAQKILAYHRDHDGLLTADDLASFRVGVEPPETLRFDGIDVHACGPWCQGPMLLQELALLDAAELRSLGHNSPAYLHRIIEAVKLAAADREAHYSDPRFVDVPMQALLSEAYSRQRRAMIDPDRAAPAMPPAGDPLRATMREAPTLARQVRSEVEKSLLDTSYLCVIDRAGNAFSATPSDGNTESPIIPGTGFVASSRGSQSRADPAHPASVMPGKRPRLTPNPALAIFPDGGVMPFGTPGGDVQTQAMLQCFLNVVLFDMDLQTAIEAPRVASYSFPSSFAPNDYRPGELCLEGRIPAETGEALSSLGHKVTWWDDYTFEAGSICMARLDPSSGVRFAAADLRRSAYAVGW